MTPTSAHKRAPNYYEFYKAAFEFICLCLLIAGVWVESPCK